MGFGRTLEGRGHAALATRGWAQVLEAGAVLPGGSVFVYELGVRATQRFGLPAEPALALSVAGFAGVRIAPSLAPWGERLRPVLRGGAQAGGLDDRTPAGRDRRPSLGPYLAVGLELALTRGVDVVVSVGGDGFVAPLVITWAGSVTLAVQTF